MPRPDRSLANWTALSQQLGPDCLRVASYNVHGCRGTDGKKDASRIAALANSRERLIGYWGERGEGKEDPTLGQRARQLAAELGAK